MTDGEKLDALHAAAYQGPREAVYAQNESLTKAVGRLLVVPDVIRQVAGYGSAVEDRLLLIWSRVLAQATDEVRR